MPGPDIALGAALEALAARRVNELHVEAGATLSGALLQAGLVDELLLYQAPMLIGPGRPLADLQPLAELSIATRWVCTEHEPVGADLRLRLRRADPEAR
jgi:diaminohydroxyphosphoribosylaminopyrimidine deaminase/5-amino-6-(5-phosphoribosylamino)uracil reductase